MVSFLWLSGFIGALMIFGAYEAESFSLAFILVCSVVFAVFAENFRRGRFEIPKSPLLIIVAAFWALAFLSVVLSEVPYTSFIYFCFFSAFPLTFLMTLLSPDKEQLFRYIGAGLAAIYAALSVSALVQYFFLPDLLFKGFVQWPLANPNSLGALLSFGFFGAFGWMLASPNRLQSNLALVLAVLIIVAFFTTGSRAAFVALVVGLAVFVLFGWAHIKKHKRCAFVLALLALVGFIGISFLSPSHAKTPADLLMAGVSGGADFLRSRPELWASAWQIIQDHTWTGTGIGTFFLYYPEYRGDDLTTAGLMAHNDPLQFWAEMGVLAPTLFYGFILAAFIRTRSALNHLKSDDPARVYILIPFCALGATIAHSHASFNFYVLSILMVAGVLLGFWFWKTHKILQQSSVSLSVPQGIQGYVFQAFSVVPILALVTFFTLFHSSYIFVRYANKSAAAGGFESFVQNINRADRLSGGKNERAFVLAASIPMGVLESQSTLLSKKDIQDHFNQAFNLLQKAQNLNPRFAVPLYYKARLIESVSKLIELDAKNNSEKLLNQALQLDPLHIPSRVMLAQIYESRGDLGRAFATLKQGLKWPYAYQDPSSYYQYAAFLALAEGDGRTHDEVIKKMLRYKKKFMQQKSLKPVTGSFKSTLFFEKSNN